jgi:hypothetical protein
MGASIVIGMNVTKRPCTGGFDPGNAQATAMKTSNQRCGSGSFARIHSTANHPNYTRRSASSRRLPEMGEAYPLALCVLQNTQDPGLGGLGHGTVLRLQHPHDASSCQQNTSFITGKSTSAFKLVHRVSAAGRRYKQLAYMKISVAATGELKPPMLSQPSYFCQHDVAWMDLAP